MLLGACVVSVLFSLAYASLPLPPYFKACHLKDPNVNECVKQSAKEGIPKLVNGDPRYKIPRLDPLEITSVKFQKGSGSVSMSLNSWNCLLYGLKDADIQSISFNYKTHHLQYDWVIPNATVSCDYNVTGKVLLLPIQGQGKSSFILKNVICNYTYDYDLVKKKDNLEYAVPKNPKLVLDAERLTVNLENLFNGNKFLGDNMNAILNDNWEELMKDMAPAFEETVGQLIHRVLGNVFGLVPYNVALLDNE
ncbi:hypothetical protein C0J52_18066 [Blattella germanica]|nr:hypothetical protein C0J52_18066 [Blattella germanica]